MSKRLRRRSGTAGLLAVFVAAAFLLVPAASAFAAANELFVTIEGSGSGEVTSSNTFGLLEGSPSIECDYASPGPQTGVCENEMTYSAAEEREGVFLTAVPSSGSELVEWRVEEGESSCFGSFCTVQWQVGEEGEGPGAGEVTAVFDEATGPSLFPLNLTTSGSGSGSFECEVEGVVGSCEAEYEGVEVKVIPTADSGSEFVEFSSENGGECTGSTCEFTMDAEHAANARFDLEPVPSFPLVIELGGTGSGSVECDIGSGPEACAAEYPEGTTLTVTDTAAAGSHFVEWIGCGSTTGNECEVTMDAAKTVEAVNDANAGAGHRLVMFVTGDGSVSADSGTLSGCTSAGGATCEGEYEGTVVLTETPGAGSVFAGWVGCRHASATTCEVAVNAEAEAYAVFLKEGTQGSTGATGATGPAGATGAPGATGVPGAPGASGPAGLQGLAGPAGSPGGKGDAGSAGAQGPAGVSGPQGPAGPKGTVTCKVQQQKSSKKVKVTCTVKYQSSKAAGSSLSWRLTRAGHTVRRGTSHDRDLSLGSLSTGTYRLHIQGKKGSRLIVIR